MTDKKDERPEGYDALPRRFKDYINALEERVRTLRSAMPSQAPTGLRIETYDRSGQEVYLPDRTRLEFSIGQERFNVCAEDDGLEIGSERSRLLILPGVSNRITITTDSARQAAKEGER
jgi:hypothetical protein